MDYKAIFIRLLKETGCYTQYINNFKKLKRYIIVLGNSKSLDNFILSSLKMRKSFGGMHNAFYWFINDSFQWDKTEEGFNYWSDINLKVSEIGNYIINGEVNKVNKDYCERFEEIRKRYIWQKDSKT